MKLISFLVVFLVWDALSIFFPNSGRIAFAGSGSTYYIASNGSDRSGCSIKSPCATIQYVMRSVARPGDTIMLRGGSYNESEIWIRGDSGYSDGGAPEKLKTIKAYPGEIVNMVNGSRPFIIEADYIRIEGLNLSNGKAIGIRGLNRSTIQIVGNTFKGSGYSWAAVDTHGNNILIEGNVCDIEGNSVGTQGHCYYISHGDKIVIRNNIAKGMAGYGIHVFDQRRSEDSQNFERIIKNMLIEGNMVSDSKQRAGIIIAAYDHARIENAVIRNNIAFNNASGGIVIRSESKNIHVYNNTVVNNGGFALSINYGGVKNASVEGLYIKNNILVINAKGDATHVKNSTNDTNITLQNNLYWPGSPRLHNISDSSPHVGDPLFVNSDVANFYLKQGSPAINKGLLLTDVSVDKDGISRPQGSGYDIGAYEYK